MPVGKTKSNTICKGIPGPHDIGGINNGGGRANRPQKQLKTIKAKPLPLPGQSQPPKKRAKLLTGEEREAYQLLKNLHTQLKGYRKAPMWESMAVALAQKYPLALIWEKAEGLVVDWNSGHKLQNPFGALVWRITTGNTPTYLSEEEARDRQEQGQQRGQRREQRGQAIPREENSPPGGNRPAAYGGKNKPQQGSGIDYNKYGPDGKYGYLFGYQSGDSAEQGVAEEG